MATAGSEPAESALFSARMIERSGYDRDGFAACYDRYRPPPPPGLLRLLTTLAQVERPGLVVDLGAGTGLSTRAWAGRAGRAAGIEPNPRMAVHARAATPQPEIRYLVAYGHRTGLATGRADLVTCAQAFHWMEPAPVLAEAARLLRSGGVFAAYDYDLPPVVQPEADAAFAAHFTARARARERLGLAAGSVSWPKQRHLAQIEASGHFRFAREVVYHGWQETDAARLTGLAESLGGPPELYEDQAPEFTETFRLLRDTARRALGTRPWPMALCYRVRVGIR
ncbi:MAG TPA: class I SAM-dependent methyltransferase [Streptosporangiaceae bacterium]